MIYFSCLQGFWLDYLYKISNLNTVVLTECQIFKLLEDSDVFSNEEFITANGTMSGCDMDIHDSVLDKSHECRM